MRPFRAIHVPHFQHFSPRSILVSVRDQLNANYGVFTVTLAVLVGLLIALTFWAVAAR